MAYIFQARPATYELQHRLEEGKAVNWLASRYHREMRRGDIVYLWQAGDENQRGIYGWGEITAAPFVDSNGAYRVSVVTRKVFPHHLNVAAIRSDPDLQDLLIFRNAIGTNFRLNDAESLALRHLVTETFGEASAPSSESR